MHLHSHSPMAGRRGVVLLVVLALLTLFAVVAITFVFFSQQEAQTSAVYVNAQNAARPDVDLLAGYVLNMLVNDTDKVTSPLRGHSLVANLYGYEGGTNIEAFNGTGRL